MGLAVGESTAYSDRQRLYAVAYVRCNGDMDCIAKYTKLHKKICVKMESDKGTSELLMKTYESIGEIGELVELKVDESGVTEEFTVTKSDRMRLLWRVANKGADMIYDMEGNMVMASPTVTVSAIKALNEMIAGSLVSKSVDVSVVVEDKRTELEIADSVKALMRKYNELNAGDNSVALPAIEHEA